MPNSAVEDTPQDRERTKSKTHKKRPKKDKKKKNKDLQLHSDLGESTPAEGSGRDDHQQIRIQQDLGATGTKEIMGPTDDDEISSTHSKNSATNFYPSPDTIQSTSTKVLSELKLLSPENIQDMINNTPELVEKLMQYTKNSERIDKDNQKKNKNLETSVMELENSQIDLTEYTLQFSPDMEKDDLLASQKNPVLSVSSRNLRSKRDKSSLEDLFTTTQAQLRPKTGSSTSSSSGGPRSVETNHSSFKKGYEDAVKTRKYLETIFNHKQSKITKDVADKIRRIINRLLDKNVRLYVDVCNLKLKIERDSRQIPLDELATKKKLQDLEFENEILVSAKNKLQGTELMVARLEGQLEENRTSIKEKIVIYQQRIDELKDDLKQNNLRLSEEISRQQAKITEGIHKVKKTMMLDLESRVNQVKENHQLVLQQMEGNYKILINEKDDKIAKLSKELEKTSSGDSLQVKTFPPKKSLSSTYYYVTWERQSTR